MVESIQSINNTKEECSLVILGHANVGKSSFCGRLMIDLNMLTQRQIDQYRTKA